MIGPRHCDQDSDVIEPQKGLLLPGWAGLERRRRRGKQRETFSGDARIGKRGGSRGFGRGAEMWPSMPHGHIVDHRCEAWSGLVAQAD